MLGTSRPQASMDRPSNHSRRTSGRQLAAHRSGARGLRSCDFSGGRATGGVLPAGWQPARCDSAGLSKRCSVWLQRYCEGESGAFDHQLTINLVVHGALPPCVRMVTLPAIPIAKERVVTGTERLVDKEVRIRCKPSESRDCIAVVLLRNGGQRSDLMAAVNSAAAASHLPILSNPFQG